MKISVKPSLLLLFSFILGYICLFLPIAKIQYQVLVGESPSNTATPKIVTYQGFASVIGYTDGEDVIPCTFPKFEAPPSSAFVILFLVWRVVGRLLCYLSLFFGYSYVIRIKISLLKFFALNLLIFAGPIAIFAMFPLEAQPICNPDDLYKIISFTPYWPTVLVLLIANLIGYRATRLINAANKDAIIAS